MSWVCTLQNIFLTCAETEAISMFGGFFSIVIYESSVPTNPYYLATVVWSVNCSSLVWKFINFILDIFRYKDSGYITKHLVLYYIEKLISALGLFLATFSWLINCMS